MSETFTEHTLIRITEQQTFRLEEQLLQWLNDPHGQK